MKVRKTGTSVLINNLYYVIVTMEMMKTALMIMCNVTFLGWPSSRKEDIISLDD